MSKSYKKTPWCGDHKGKLKKRIANHHVRKWLKENPKWVKIINDVKKEADKDAI